MSVELLHEHVRLLKEREVLTKCNRTVPAGDGRSLASYRDSEELSSTSSFGSASRASPTPSFSADNLLHFPGDSSGSI